jgi:hypothetical protein
MPKSATSARSNASTTVTDAATLLSASVAATKSVRMYILDDTDFGGKFLKMKFCGRMLDTVPLL